MRSSGFGVRSEEFGVWSSERGVRSLEFGARSSELGVRNAARPGTPNSAPRTCIPHSPIRIPQYAPSCYRHGMTQTSPKAGDVIEVITEKIAYGGDAVARHEGLVVFVPYAAPGERVRVRITEQKRNFARASIVELLDPSEARRDPTCNHFGTCGGCQLQHMSYAAQLEAKGGFVRDAIERIGRIDWPHPIPVRPSAEFGYRSRARFKIQPIKHTANEESDASSLNVGFNQAGSNSVCDIAFCPVLTGDLNEALAAVRKAATTQSVPGRLREVEAASGDSGFSIQPSLAGLSSGAIEVSMSGTKYCFEPSVFFQSNISMISGLMEAVAEAHEGELAVDLYCGAGLFTLGLARRFRKVIGVESDPAAARLARKNLSSNGATNARVANLSAEEWAKNFGRRGASGRVDPPSLIVLDPPRTGAAAAIHHIADIGAKAVTYVSCDPATLARDLRILVDKGYQLHEVIAFDLFPQTYHVETVVKLRLR